MEKTRILIVEDHPLMRRALQTAIETEPDLTVVGTAPNGVQALALLPEARPDVVLMDLLMPEGDGLEAIAAIRAAHPTVHILVVTSVEDEAEILQAIQSGALGYLTKTADAAELLAAIRQVRAGEAYLPVGIAGKLMTSVRQMASVGPIQPLTGREAELLDLLGRGLSNQQIAAALHISSSTVRVHLHNILSKLGFAHRGEAVVYAARQRAG